MLKNLEYKIRRLNMSRTKKLLALLLTTAMLLSLVVTASAVDNSNISFKADKQNATANDTITVTVSTNATRQKVYLLS